MIAAAAPHRLHASVVPQPAGRLEGVDAVQDLAGARPQYFRGFDAEAREGSLVGEDHLPPLVHDTGDGGHEVEDQVVAQLGVQFRE